VRDAIGPHNYGRASPFPDPSLTVQRASSSHFFPASAAPGAVILGCTIGLTHLSVCLSIGLSGGLIWATNSNTKRCRKPKLVWMFPRAGVAGVPIFTAQNVKGQVSTPFPHVGNAISRNIFGGNDLVSPDAVSGVQNSLECVCDHGSAPLGELTALPQTR